MQARNKTFSPVCVGLEDDLGVTFTGKTYAVPDQFCAQLAVIVDGTVEYQRKAQCFIDPGLVGRIGQIDHRQASMPQ